MRKIAALLAGVFISLTAGSQSVPNGTIAQGQIWTTAQWNTAWQAKADVTGGSLAHPTITSPTITGGTLSSPAVTGTLTVAGVDVTTASILTSGTIATARLGSGTASSSTYLRGDQSWATIPSGAAAANPTGTIGLAAVNGSASTFMRSDGAPPLSQGISPTWTGNHTFTPTSGIALTVNSADSSGSAAFNSASSAAPSFNTFGNGGTVRAFEGTAGTAGDLVAGSGVGDYIFRTNATALRFTVNGGASSAVTVGTLGNVAIAQPSSAAVALSVSGAPQPGFSPAVFISAPGTPGQSNGLKVTAGTNASDATIQFNNAASTVAYLTIFGDGGIITNGQADEGVGTINAAGLFVNGVAVSTPGPAAAGTLTGSTLASNVVASSLTSVGTLSGLNVSGAINSGGIIQAGSFVGPGAATTGTFTATTVGLSGATMPCSWTKTGNSVTLFVGVATGTTGTGSGFAISNLPSAIQPATSKYAAGLTIGVNNSSQITVSALVSGAVLNFGMGANFSGWTVGVRGVGDLTRGVTFTWDVT